MTRCCLTAVLVIFLVGSAGAQTTPLQQSYQRDQERARQRAWVNEYNARVDADNRRYNAEQAEQRRAQEAAVKARTKELEEEKLHGPKSTYPPGFKPGYASSYKSLPAHKPVKPATAAPALPQPDYPTSSRHH